MPAQRQARSSVRKIKAATAVVYILICSLLLLFINTAQTASSTMLVPSFASQIFSVPLLMSLTLHHRRSLESLRQRESVAACDNVFHGV